MKKKIIIKPDEKCFEFEGRKFKEKTTKYKKIDGVEHIDKIIFEEIDLDEEKKRINFIKEKLTKKIPTERVVEEVLKRVPTKELKKIEKLLKKKGTKIKRHDGCLGLKIDGGKRNNTYLELFD
jgi:hypothetical protein